MKKFKKLLAGFMTLAMLVTMLPATVLAAEKEVATADAFADAIADAENNDIIKLTADITTTSAMNIAGKTLTLDLGNNELTIGVGDNKFTDETNLTIKNGTINITGLTVSGNAIFCLDEYEKTLVTTLTLENVDVIGDGYSSAYGVFYIGDSSVLNVIGGEWNLKDDAFSAGGVFKADAAAATLNITNTKMTLHNVRRAVTHATTTIKNANIAISGDADGVDAEMEHGFNRSALTIVDSTITMKDMAGRGITAENGAVSIEGNSTVTMENVQEATIQVNNGKTVMIAETATVTVDETPTIANGSIVGTVAESPKGSNSYAYTKEVDGYVRVWGEGGGNAKESFVLKLYSKDELIATTKLNNVGGIIDGDVYVTWNFFYPESNDEYWTTTWEAGHPQSAAQPTKVELYIDGQMVAETAAKMSGADDVNPVVWRELGGVAQTDIVAEENGEFLIKNVDDLKAFATMVNAGNNFSGKTVKLAADIDLKNEEWTPIGNSTNKFQGTFDGQNHMISNLLITGNKSDVGLFGFTTNGEIKNLIVYNANVSGRLNVGAVAGTPYTTKYTNIKLLGHVEINGMSYVGGIGGKNAYANWTDITVNVDSTSYVKANSVENGTAYRTYVGGVIGFMGEGGHTFRNITSNINVIGSTCDIGGITGIAHYGNNFINVSCSGDVTTEADNVEDACETGGIAGVWNNGGAPVTFKNMEYTGKLSAPNVKEDFTFPNAGLVGGAYSANGSGELKTDMVAYIGSTTFTTLKAALSAATANDTVYLMTGIKVTENEQFVVGEQESITLNLNGSTLKCKGFLNKGTLNIMNGTLICDEFAYSAIESTGTLNVTDVDVTAARHAIRVEGGTAVIDGGTYKTGTVGKTTHAVNVSDGGEVIIKDGTFVGPAAVTGTDSGSAVNCQKDSKVTIENGKFSSGKRNTLAAAGNLIVKGGYFDQDPAAYVAEGYKVKDNDDATYLYKVTGYSTNIGHGFQTIISDDREAITTTLEDVYAKDSLVVKIYSGNTLLGTTTLKAVDDEGNAMYPATGEYTVNNVINGRESGSWDTVWNVELTRKNVPTKIEVYADGKLTDTYTDADGCFLDEENKTAYVGLFPEIVDVPSSPSGNGGGSTSKKYSVEIDEDIENGSIKLDRTKAKSGTEVTITATPDKGYKLDELKVLNSRGTEIDLEDNGDGTFTFKMPKGGVDIEASFVEGEAESEAPAGEKESLVLTINQVIYQLNGSYAANDVAPIIKGDRTMLPIRLIAEFLGATVTWNEAEQSVTIVKDDTTIVIYIDQAFAMVNGEPVQLDAPAFIANDRTYLPLRFIAENLGAEVVWNGANNTVTIYK